NRSGKDLYMTWITKSQETASRIPVWGYEVVWTGPTDSPTLMAGRVVLKNPERDPTADEVITVMRLDRTGVVNTRGVLFPVSNTTWENYRNHVQGKTDGWQRDYSGDATAMAVYLESTARTLARKREKPLGEVYTLRDTQVAPLPKVQAGFPPAFNVVKPLGRGKSH
ncbi:MAG: hypothetical protein AAB408_01385, partial [Patescibacteria group bacterium]